MRPLLRELPCVRRTSGNVWVVRGLTVRGSIVGTRQDLQEALEFYAEGKVHPTVSTRELSEVNAVLDEMKHAKIDGRVVIKY